MFLLIGWGVLILQGVKVCVCRGLKFALSHWQTHLVLTEGWCYCTAHDIYCRRGSHRILVNSPSKNKFLLATAKKVEVKNAAYKWSHSIFVQVKFFLSFWCNRRNFLLYWCASCCSGSWKSVVVLENRSNDFPVLWLVARKYLIASTVAVESVFFITGLTMNSRRSRLQPCKLNSIHNRFTALFPGPPGWAGARRELLDFMVQGKINRGRHTDHAAGRHSIRTNQCPPPPSPIFLQAGCPSCYPTNSVKALKATSAFKLGRRW